MTNKVFCCGPCKSQPLKIEVTIPKRGFVIGENIPVTILVQNESRVPVEEIKAKLYLNAHYRGSAENKAESGTRNQTIVISKNKIEERVLRYTNKKFDCNLNVPLTPPTCDDLCPLIEIRYKIIIVAKVKGWHTNSNIILPVTIGSIPLHNTPTIVDQQPTSTTSVNLSFLNVSNNIETHRDDIKSSNNIPLYEDIESIPTAPPIELNDDSDLPTYENLKFNETNSNVESDNVATAPPTDFNDAME